VEKLLVNRASLELVAEFINRYIVTYASQPQVPTLREYSTLLLETAARLDYLQRSNIELEDKLETARARIDEWVEKSP